jgi:hypothetical protein
VNVIQLHLNRTTGFVIVNFLQFKEKRDPSYEINLGRYTMDVFLSVAQLQLIRDYLPRLADRMENPEKFIKMIGTATSE